MTPGQRRAAAIIRTIDYHIGAVLKVLTVSVLGLAAGLAWRTNARLAYALLAVSILTSSGAFSLCRISPKTTHQRRNPKA